MCLYQSNVFIDEILPDLSGIPGFYSGFFAKIKFKKINENDSLIH
jgi:hypothetical protein